MTTTAVMSLSTAILRRMPWMLTMRTMYSIHQFIALDEARDSMAADDSEQDAAHNDATV